MEIAREYNAVIVPEDLEKPKDKEKNAKLSWESHLWYYRRIQTYIEYKASIEGVRVVYANPKGTSKESPNGKPLVFINYRFAMLGGTITTRDRWLV